mgnify:FL=1
MQTVTNVVSDTEVPIRRLDRFNALLNRWLGPPAWVTGQQEIFRVSALMIITVLLALVPVGVLVADIVDYELQPQIVVATALTFVGAAVAYRLGRTRHYLVSMALVSALTSLWTLAFVTWLPRNHAIMLALAPILVYSQLWPLRLAAPLSAAMLALTAGLAGADGLTSDWQLHMILIAMIAIIILAWSQVNRRMWREMSARVAALAASEALLRQERDALRLSEEKFNRTFHATPDAITITRQANGTYLEVNDSFVTLSGYTREEVIGRSTLDINIWADPQDRARLVETLQTQGQVQNLESSFRRKDGSLVASLVSARTLRVDGEDCILAVVRDISDYKRVEAALRESEERFRQLAEYMQVGFWIFDIPSQKILYTNPVYRQIAGLSEEEIEADPYKWLERAHPDDVAMLMRAVERQEMGEPIDVELRVTQADGVRWYRSRAYPIKDSAGQPYRIFGLVEDIHERRLAAEALRRSEDLARQFQDRLKKLHTLTLQLARAATLDDLCRQTVEAGRERLGFERLSIWFLDDRNIHALCGSFGTDETGQTRDERGRFYDYTAPAALANDTPIDQGILDIVRNQRRATFWPNIPLRDDRGEVIGRGWAAAAGLWDGDRVIGVIFADNLLTGQPPAPYQIDLLALYASAVGSLVTRLRAEQALRASEQRYRLLADNASDVIWMLSLDGRFTYVSPSVERLRGYTPDEVLAQPLAEALTPESLAVAQQAMERLVAALAAQPAGRRDPLTVRYELEQPCKDGSTVWTEVIASVIYDEAGQAAGILGVSRDISERRRLEAQRLELESERQRSILLQQFVGDVFHDLMTPITVSKTNLYLLEKSGLSEAQTKRAQTLDEQIARLETIIRDMLTLLQLDQLQPSDLVLKPYNVNLIVGQIGLDYQPQADERRQSLRTALAPDLPAVLCDTERLARAVANLVENALKYTPDGSHIEIATHRRGQFIEITVTDDGPGISPADLPRIFERFYRAEAHRPARGGAGLGLAITRKIVEAHGGTIQAHSMAGRGATFSIYLPLPS